MSKWDTLVHKGPVFPNSFVPPNIPIIYDNKKVSISPTGQHLAILFAKTKDSLKDSTFNHNFFSCWKNFIPSSISNISLCDFSPFLSSDIPNYTIPRTHKFCYINGCSKKVSFPLIEPTCIFKGRGSHPLRGSVKFACTPKDITVNCSDASKLSKKPWGNIVCDKSVSWLAMYSDSLGNKKYIFPDSLSDDFKKFELARTLKRKLPCLNTIVKDLYSDKDVRKYQKGCVLYLVIKLSIRIGHEKPENTADTVGCCTLRKEHISFRSNNIVDISFLGKDSINFHKSFSCNPEVYKKLQLCCSRKNDSNLIFDKCDACSINYFLQNFIPGLTAKVIRTCNASRTFQSSLNSFNSASDNPIKHYKECAIKIAKLCNHVRKVKASSSFPSSTSKTNYLDPRITFAYAKKHKLHISSLFSPSLVSKHKWAKQTLHTFQF